MLHRSLLIDGMLSGTGVRDAINGGYIEPKALGLSTDLIIDLADWLHRYEKAHFGGFDAQLVSELDDLGIVLMARDASELPQAKVAYFSNGLMKHIG